MTQHDLLDGDKRVRFTGLELASQSSFAQGKPRWFELKIYRTEAGSYVISGAGRTTVPGEKDRCWVKVAGTAAGAVEALHQYDDDDVRYLTRVAQDALTQACELDDELCAEYQVQHIR